MIIVNDSVSSALRSGSRGVHKPQGPRIGPQRTRHLDHNHRNLDVKGEGSLGRNDWQVRSTSRKLCKNMVQ